MQLHQGFSSLTLTCGEQFSLWALSGAYSLAASLALYPLGASTTSPVPMTKRFSDISDGLKEPKSPSLKATSLYDQVLLDEKH